MTAKKFIRFPILILLTLALSGAAVTVAAQPFDCSRNRHDYVLIQTIPPTETNDGSVTYECRLCGNIFIETLFATGCEWGEWRVNRQPTCTEPGLRSRICSVGVTHSEYEEIPVLGHQWEETVTPPTCTEPGRQIRTCSLCGESGTEVYGEPLGHHYIETITREPACGREGERTFTCEHCGHYYTEPIPALEHNFGEWVIDTAAEQGVEGRRYRECSLCGYRIWETIDAYPIPPTEMPPIEPPPAEARPFFGVEEAIVTGANVVVWIIGGFVMFVEFGFLAWKRRKTKELLAVKQMIEKSEDGYEYI